MLRAVNFQRFWVVPQTQQVESFLVRIVDLVTQQVAITRSLEVVIIIMQAEIMQQSVAEMATWLLVLNHS